MSLIHMCQLQSQVGWEMLIGKLTPRMVNGLISFDNLPLAPSGVKGGEAVNISHRHGLGYGEWVVLRVSLQGERERDMTESPGGGKQSRQIRRQSPQTESVRNKRVRSVGRQGRRKEAE